MNGLSNLAGHAVSIFLFCFVGNSTGISFVVNEAIAEDMYPEVDEQIRPLAHACCETLLRYKHLSVSDTIMDGTILETGECEVMLSTGLGRHFPDAEKQALFQDAKHLANLLVEVMNRRTQEEKEGTQTSPPRSRATPHPTRLKQGLEALGHTKRLQAEMQWVLEGQHIRPGVQPLRPEDLPPGVTAARGYDHRGQCVTFAHETLGELGKIVLIATGDGRTLVQAELYTGQTPGDAPLGRKRREVFEHIVATVNQAFDDNFPG